LSLWDLKHSFGTRVLPSLRFELCPYGIWNETTFLKESGKSWFELCPYGIWNGLFVFVTSIFKYLNFVPMGFETKMKKCLVNIKKNLNFVPMGFETIIRLRGKRCFSIIWTLSLWDLKPNFFKILFDSHQFELCPYGIWNKD